MALDVCVATAHQAARLIGRIHSSPIALRPWWPKPIDQVGWAAFRALGRSVYDDLSVCGWNVWVVRAVRAKEKEKSNRFLGWLNKKVRVGLIVNSRWGIHRQSSEKKKREMLPPPILVSFSLCSPSPPCPFLFWKHVCFKIRLIFPFKKKTKVCVWDTVAALWGMQYSDGCTGNGNKQCTEQNFCIKKKGCVLHLSNSSLPHTIFTQLCFVKCVLLLFFVIYLTKIVLHLFCGELLSQSCTDAFTDVKGGQETYPRIL